MQLRKYRWSRDYESAEEELTSFFTHHKIKPERWHAEAFEEFELQALDYDRQLWCAEGSIMVSVTDDRGHMKEISLQPGDALDIPLNTPHSAIAGISGVVCYEHHV